MSEKSILVRSESVAYYAARVRAALDGLDPDVVDELTDGLEADLSEAVLDAVALEGAGPGESVESPAAVLESIDGEAVLARFGPPSDYAAELAAAAGVELPLARQEARRRPFRDAFALTSAGVRGRVDGLVAKHAWLREGVEMLRTLRPVWWVARGWGWAVVGMWLANRALPGRTSTWVPDNVLDWAVLLILVAASVQLGRGRIWQGRWGRRLGVLASWVGGVLAFAALCNVLSVVGTDHEANLQNAYDAGVRSRDNGVYIDGLAATNIFAYGPDGQPLPGVRILDQNGREIILSNGWDGSSWAQTPPDAIWWGGSVPVALLDPDLALNAYPLAFLPVDENGQPVGVSMNDYGVPVLDPDVTLAAPQWPVPSLPVLVVPSSNDATTPSVDPTPSADPTAEADSSADPSAEASATPEEAAPSDAPASNPEPTP
ncbi:hypothetical protein [Miniimonas sp. S16]|uniref:HAAS signaling domain-containing protein n=1 Tax=Miniimonas sp. S16 TaxID=2171623 RepID=UPI000D526064|nr:hypothetical protein [Miniimonas sp. S16]